MEKKEEDFKVINIIKKIETIKECYEYLSGLYKFVRVIELHNSVSMETPLVKSFSFKKFILASNELETYKKTTKILKKKIEVITNVANITMRLFRVFGSNEEYIPVFISEKECNYKISFN